MLYVFPQEAITVIFNLFHLMSYSKGTKMVKVHHQTSFFFTIDKAHGAANGKLTSPSDINNDPIPKSQSCGPFVAHQYTSAQ